VDAEVPEIFFTRDLKGYGWVVRKGNYLNIGLGRQDTQRLGSHVKAFLAVLERRGKIPANRPVKPRGHPYLLSGQAQRPLIGDAALLMGDAAGLAYPKSGEGIRPAIESGLLAAQTILDAQGQYDRDSLRAYERRIMARFGRRRAGWGITDIVPGRLAGVVAGRLLSMAWFARHVVLDRWFFQVHQAPLLPATLIGSASPRPAARPGVAAQLDSPSDEAGDCAILP
jgi:2-polyprenyl-6-methoxyphenol hydroxylase-like FAD-dependent oxidoreductase